RSRHTRSLCDWSSDVCSSDLFLGLEMPSGEIPWLPSPSRIPVPLWSLAFSVPHASPRLGASLVVSPQPHGWAESGRFVPCDLNCIATVPDKFRNSGNGTREPCRVELCSETWCGQTEKPHRAHKCIDRLPHHNQTETRDRVGSPHLEAVPAGLPVWDILSVLLRPIAS